MESLARVQQAACWVLQGSSEDWAEIPPCARGTGCPGEGPNQSVGREGLSLIGAQRGHIYAICLKGIHFLICRKHHVC